MDPAFAQHYPDLRLQVRFYLRHQFRDQVDVDEITDAVLEKLLVHWPSVRKPLNWALTAAKRLALDELRRAPVEHIDQAAESVSRWMSTSSVVDERVQVDAILDALHTLSVSERKAIVLAALGYTNPEIAELLDLAPASVPRCLYAGRKKLEKILRYRRRQSSRTSKSRRSSGRGPGRA